MRVTALIFALAIVAANATAATAQAQSDKDKYDLKPLLPPVLPLPPNALVTPGGNTAASPADRTPLTGNSRSEPAAPGLKITIPGR